MYNTFMIHYLTHWMHAYFTHFGMWVTLLGLGGLYKDGLPKYEELLPTLKVILIIAIVMSLFSSHAQTHLLTQFLNK